MTCSWQERMVPALVGQMVGQMVDRVTLAHACQPRGTVVLPYIRIKKGESWPAMNHHQ